jgi:hypothetical protein
MHFEAALEREALPTLVALKRLVFYVHGEMLHVIALLYEGFPAYAARVRLLSRV